MTLLTEIMQAWLLFLWSKFSIQSKIISLLLQVLKALSVRPKKAFDHFVQVDDMHQGEAILIF